MIRFVMPDRVSDLISPDAARIFSGDDITVRGEVRVEAGCLVAVPESDEVRGITVRLDGDALLDGACRAGFGRIALSTCLLTARERPYGLVLELARRRVMHTLTKLEEWAPPEGDEAVGEMISRATEAFTRALVHSGGGEGDAQALTALTLAMEVSRELALLQGRRLLPGRLSGEIHADAVARYERAQQESAPPGAPVLLSGGTGVVLPGRPLLGVEVEPGLFAEGLGRIASGSCDFIQTPMRWSDLEPEEGAYSFASTDRWIEWAVRQAKIPVASGALIDFRPQRTPEWLEIWENDHETLRELVAEHVKQVVTRYRRTIRRWSAVCGLEVNRSFPMEFEKMIDLTRIAVTLIRRLHPQANIVLDVDLPWGEYLRDGAGALPPLPYAEMTQQAGIQVDGYALRLRMDQEGGSWNRDPMELSVLLDRYALQLERPLLVSAVGVPSEGEAWDEGLQARWLDEVLQVVLSKPYIHSVCWQTLYDTESRPAAGLLTQTGAPKASARRFAEIRSALREGRSPWLEHARASVDDAG